LSRTNEIRQRLQALANVGEIILMTHLASSDDFSSNQTLEQIRAFQSVSDTFKGALSLANSAAVLGWPKAHAQWVRTGGMLYGLSVVSGKTGAEFGLRPAMSLTTKLIAINKIKAGDRLGYGAQWQCPEDMLVGVAAIGYGDGYPRHVPSGTPVLVNGKHAAIIGRVSMDLMCIDLRGHPQVQVGSPVLLWGPQLPVEIIANAAETISYELTCSITRRVGFIESDQ